MGLTSCLFRHSQYSPFRLFIVFLRLTSTTGKLFLQVLDFNLFIILGILFVSVLILILEYRPYKRKKVLIELEKNSNSGTNI
ncbi:hypothetical protein CDH83_07920 [Streptococcus agalactiae]|nr:hypothetical protein CDH83_07920 [Streptococcus agalactiae]